MSVVLLSGGVVRMTCQSLDPTKRHTCHYHVRAECMPKPMKVSTNACQLRILLEPVGHSVLVRRNQWIR